MDAIKNVGAILGVLLSSGVLASVITHIIGHFSKKSLDKVEYAKTKIDIYSPIVQFLTSTDLRNNSVEYILEIIENYLYEKYDNVAPNIIIQFAKLKAKVTKGELREFSTKDFIKLYFLIQIEYNMAKKNSCMNYDIRYTSVDIGVPIYLNYLYGIICIILIIIAAILGVTGALEWGLTNSFSMSISILYIIIMIIVLVTYKIEIIITRHLTLKEWGLIIADKLQRPNIKNAIQTQSHE